MTPSRAGSPGAARASALSAKLLDGGMRCGCLVNGPACLLQPAANRRRDMPGTVGGARREDRNASRRGRVKTVVRGLVPADQELLDTRRIGGDVHDPGRRPVVVTQEQVPDAVGLTREDLAGRSPAAVDLAQDPQVRRAPQDRGNVRNHVRGTSRAVAAAEAGPPGGDGGVNRHLVRGQQPPLTSCSRTPRRGWWGVRRRAGIGRPPRPTLGSDGRTEVARHAGSVRKGLPCLLRDHYLEVLMHEPRALRGATALALARAAGTFTSVWLAQTQQPSVLSRLGRAQRATISCPAVGAPAARSVALRAGTGSGRRCPRDR